MKKPLTFLLLLLLTAGSVVAQNRILRKSVDDSGRRLVVEIDLERDGQPVHFKGKFDVSHLDRRGKERLLNRLLDSLALPRDAQRVALLDNGDSNEAEAKVTAAREVHEAKQARDARSRNVALAAEKAKIERNKAVFDAEAGAFSPTASLPADLESLVPESQPAPYSRSIDDNPTTGTLRMRYVYHREGDERVYERTVDVRGKSQREKKRLVEETERLWNLSLTNQPL